MTLLTDSTIHKTDPLFLRNRDVSIVNRSAFLFVSAWWKRIKGGGRNGTKFRILASEMHDTFPVVATSCGCKENSTMT